MEIDFVTINENQITAYEVRFVNDSKNNFTAFTKTYPAAKCYTVRFVYTKKENDLAGWGVIIT